MVPGNGAQGRNRTSDTVIFSHVLYQLSYLGFQGVSCFRSVQLGPEHPLDTLLVTVPETTSRG